ncbi:MAG: LamG-like jellyroll fold domain-containing protein, partial [Planctomycetota bacterium]
MCRETRLILGLVLLIVLLPACILVQTAVGAEKNYFPSFADEHTVGLWLFDETDYPYTTLTDASQYEYDLRLMKGGRLVPGKFGRSLKLTPGLDYAVGYSAWKGHISFAHLREVSGKSGSGLWGPTVAPEKLLSALNGHDFTCELWVMLMSSPIQDVVLIDLGDKYNRGFKLTLKKKAAGFVVENAYAGFKATCPAILEQIWGRAWHHVAFTYSAVSKKLEYFIDGKSQGSVPVSVAEKSSVPSSVWPESFNRTKSGNFEKKERTDAPDFEKRRKNRFNFAIGHDRHGNGDFDGGVDELRFSDVVRYTKDFGRPDSFSRNYRKGAAKPAVANGPPLLFGLNKTYLPNDVLNLGSRKHVFIDDVMIARKHNVRLQVNPVTDGILTKGLPGDCGDSTIFDHDGKVWMVWTPGYESGVGRTSLYISGDGINFSA